jgi:hypothetical protein
VDAPRDTPLALCINAWSEELPFRPPALPGVAWSIVLDTSDPAATARPLDASDAIAVGARSLVVARGEPA